MGAGFSKLPERACLRRGGGIGSAKESRDEPLFEILPALFPRFGPAQSGGGPLATQVDPQGPRTGSRNRRWFGSESAVLFERGRAGVGSGPIAGIAALGTAAV